MPLPGVQDRPDGGYQGTAQDTLPGRVPAFPFLPPILICASTATRIGMPGNGQKAYKTPVSQPDSSIIGFAKHTRVPEHSGAQAQKPAILQRTLILSIFFNPPKSLKLSISA
jgi:hypothetical protein